MSTVNIAKGQRYTDGTGATRASSVTGVVRYNPKTQRVVKAKDGTPLDVAERKSPFIINAQGQEYLDPFTGKPAPPVIEQDVFDDIYTRGEPVLRWNVDIYAKQQAEALRAKGIEPDVTDEEYFKRKFITDVADANAVTSVTRKTNSTEREAREKTATPTKKLTKKEQQALEKAAEEKANQEAGKKAIDKVLYGFNNFSAETPASAPDPTAIDPASGQKLDKAVEANRKRTGMGKDARPVSPPAKEIKAGKAVRKKNEKDTAPLWE
jgi:hypothetical protein